MIADQFGLELDTHPDMRRNIFKNSVPLSLLLLVSGPVLADYKRDYYQGIDAADKNEWQTVQSKMREALRENSTPAKRIKLYGTLYADYVPEFYLGMAAYQTGDCDQAVTHWEHGPTQSILAGNNDLKAKADAGLRDCRAKLLARAERARPRPVAEVKPEPLRDPPSGKPTTAPKTAVAQQLPPRPAPAPAPARPVTTAPTGVAAPAALVSMLNGYLSGRYAELATLDIEQFRESPTRWHALVLRSAARSTQAWLAQSGQTSLASVEADIREAKKIQPGKVPDESLFSPRFRALFATTR